MPVQIKNHKVLNALLSVPYHGKLIEVICWVAFRYVDRDRPLVITSGYRAGDKGVHGTRPYCRGIDIRSSTFSDPQAVVDDVNNHFTYDPFRPTHKVDGAEQPLNVAKYHESKPGAGFHIHLQVHGRTVYNKGGKEVIEDGTG